VSIASCGWNNELHKLAAEGHRNTFNHNKDVTTPPGSVTFRGRGGLHHEDI